MKKDRLLLFCSAQDVEPKVIEPADDISLALFLRHQAKDEIREEPETSLFIEQTCVIRKLLLALLKRIGQLFPKKRYTDKSYIAISFLRLSDERRQIRQRKDGAKHIPLPRQLFPRKLRHLFLSRPHEQEAILERRLPLAQRHVAHIEQSPDRAAYPAPAARILGKRQGIAPFAAGGGECGEEEECLRLLGNLFVEFLQDLLIALPEIAALQGVAQDAHMLLQLAASFEGSFLRSALHRKSPSPKALKP